MLPSPLIENGYCNNLQENVQKPVMQKSKRTPSEWFKKYFWEGQKLHGISEEEKQFSVPSNATFEQKILIKYKNLIALLIPFSVAQFIWWSSAFKYNFFSLYKTHWQMPLTMVVGSIIAGMTSEGGGAVAFPVMIFILHTKPHTARDFSIMIQAIGMTMALFVILFMRIQIEWRAIIFGTLGAIPGALIGFTLIEPLFTPQSEKMLFVSIWSSFAISLWILNCEKKRKTFNTIQNFCVWKCLMLILTGFVGVTVPVTSICAPIGSFLGSHFHRQTLAWLVYILELVSYIGFIFTAPPLQLVVPSILIIALGFGFFRLMSNWGKRMLDNKHFDIDHKIEIKKHAIARKASEERMDI